MQIAIIQTLTTNIFLNVFSQLKNVPSNINKIKYHGSIKGLHISELSLGIFKLNARISIHKRRIHRYGLNEILFRFRIKCKSFVFKMEMIFLLSSIQWSLTMLKIPLATLYLFTSYICVQQNYSFPLFIVFKLSKHSPLKPFTV